MNRRMFLGIVGVVVIAPFVPQSPSVQPVGRLVLVKTKPLIYATDELLADSAVEFGPMVLGAFDEVSDRLGYEWSWEEGEA